MLSRYRPYAMWALPLLFFAYQFILRLWPGLMMQPIMEQFSIHATEFGFLAALYYYGYAGFQIPVALLLDRFGPRIILSLLALICGLATFTFSFTTEWWVACLSRFLVGVGSAAGFLSISKVLSEWFPQKDYAPLIGWSFTIGLMGAIYGGKPVSLLIAHYHWPTVASVLGIVAIAIALLTVFFLRSPSHTSFPKTEEEENRQTQDLPQKGAMAFLCSVKSLWVLAIANLLMVGSLEGFADVWGVPYLMSAYGFSQADAAGLISFVFIGMLFGGPVLAWINRKIHYYPLIASCGLGMALLFILLLKRYCQDPWMLSLILFAIGLLCCYQVIIFAAGSHMVPRRYLGISISFLNAMNMLGGSFFHSMIGKMMDLSWQGEWSAEGLRYYEPNAYQSALMIIPTCAVLGAVLSFFLNKRLHTTADPRESGHT